MPRKCMEDGCNKYASFNIHDEKCGIYCFKHKKEDMINVYNKHCEHSKRKSNCKECGGSSICEHGRRKSECKDCGGNSICEHNKVKSSCKECGGSKFCEHGRQKSCCKLCGGSSICEHDRVKSKCKECGGSSICEHNRIKSSCRECGGSLICEHKRLKSQCIECGGSQICEHDRVKSRCKKCGGSQICEHGKRKTDCKECGGKNICKHKQYKSRCKECGGSSLCEHNRDKSYCKECGGSQICEHNKEKRYCKQCRGNKICEHNKFKSCCKLCGGNQLCKSSWCETKKCPNYDGYCFSCFVHLFPDMPNARNYKTKEKATADYVLERFPEFTWMADKQIQDGCSKKRPDLLLDLGYQVIVVEIDENQHESYDCSCENKRIMLLSQDVGHRPMVFIRFNPDDYLSSDGKVTSCWSLNNFGVCTVKRTKVKEWNERLEALNAQIVYWSHPENKTEKTVEIVQLFYDCD